MKNQSEPYSVIMRSVGNPDCGQTGAISEPVEFKGATLSEIVEACRRYIGENNLGGGNWPMTFVMKDGKKIGHISYNGRLWDLVEREIKP